MALNSLSDSRLFFAFAPRWGNRGTPLRMRLIWIQGNSFYCNMTVGSDQRLFLQVCHSIGTPRGARKYRSNDSLIATEWWGCFLIGFDMDDSLPAERVISFLPLRLSSPESGAYHTCFIHPATAMRAQRWESSSRI